MTRSGAARWPTSDRNPGRLRIGTGGRLHIGMHGRLRRNLHEPAQRAVRVPAKLTALQPALRTEPARSAEAQPWSAFRLPARASDIDRSNRWPGINSESSATSIPVGSDAARTESHAFLQPAGVDSRRTNLALSSYAENRAAAEAPQPMRARAGAAERKRAVRREAAFSLSVFTAALAIALLLSGAILKLACRTNTQDHRRTAETWLQDSTS